MISKRVTRGMRVLDVGGGGGTSGLATHIIDRMTYDEWMQRWIPEGVEIARENWCVHDVCERVPWDYPDDFFDFVICSHTLEDVRDPIWVCQEMSRVGRAGYVETPSVFLELTRGMNTGFQAGKWVGYCHHRWLVAEECGVLLFRQKPYFLHSSRRFHFPRRYRERWMKADQAYLGVFWEGKCIAKEVVMPEELDMKAEIEAFILAGEGAPNLAMRMHRMRETLWCFGKSLAKILAMDRRVRQLFSGK